MELHTRGYNFIKLPPVKNDIGNVPEKKRLLFTEGAGHEMGGFFACAN